MRPVALQRLAYFGDRFACPLFAHCHCVAGECFAGYVCPSHRLGASQPAVALPRSCIGCQRPSRYADRTMQVASHPQQPRWLAEAAHSASASCWDHQLVGCQMVGHLHWQSNLASEPIPAVAYVAIPDNSDKHSYRTGGTIHKGTIRRPHRNSQGRVKRAGFACSQPPPPTSGSLAAIWPGLCRSLCRPLPSHQPPSQQSPVACKFRSASSGSEKPWPSMPSQLWFGSSKKKRM